MAVSRTSTKKLANLAKESQESLPQARCSLKSLEKQEEGQGESTDDEKADSRSRQGGQGN